MTVFSASSHSSHTLSLSLYHTHSPRVLMKGSALLSPPTSTALSYMTFSKCPFQLSSGFFNIYFGGGGGLDEAFVSSSSECWKHHTKVRRLQSDLTFSSLQCNLQQHGLCPQSLKMTKFPALSVQDEELAHSVWTSFSESSECVNNSEIVNVKCII